MAKRLKILSVMHHVPLQSGFLAEKFVRLNEHADMHMLVWDTKEHARQFADKHRLSVDKIHSGVYNKAGVVSNCLLLLYLIAVNGKVRKYILRGSFINHVKKVLAYLPVFFAKPDIIHFEFGTLAKDIEILKQLTNEKMIVSFRGYDMYYVGLDDKSYYKDVWEHADGFHFLGNDLKQHAIKRGYAGNTIEAIIPPAVDVDFFQRHAASMSSKEIRIISVGRLTWRKGYDYAIQAMKLLKDRGISFQYTIVGAGEHLQAIQFMIAEFGLEDNVHLKGSLNKEEVKAELSKSDIFLQASVSEGFCNAVIEAQAMALPVVSTDAGGLPENVEDNVTGFIVPTCDAKAIANKIEWCYNNKSALSIIGKNGAIRARENFKIEDQVKAFVDLYYKVHVS
jgi:colanic acid/amylovoran biosynthesis glycosyltransferase